MQRICLIALIRKTPPHMITAAVEVPQKQKWARGGINDHESKAVRVSKCTIAQVCAKIQCTMCIKCIYTSTEK